MNLKSSNNVEKNSKLHKVSFYEESRPVFPVKYVGISEKLTLFGLCE